MTNKNIFPSTELKVLSTDEFKTLIWNLEPSLYSRIPEDVSSLQFLNNNDVDIKILNVIKSNDLIDKLSGINKLKLVLGKVHLVEYINQNQITVEEFKCIDAYMCYNYTDEEALIANYFNVIEALCNQDSLTVVLDLVENYSTYQISKVLTKERVQSFILENTIFYILDESTEERMFGNYRMKFIKSNISTIASASRIDVSSLKDNTLYNWNAVINCAVNRSGITDKTSLKNELMYIMSNYLKLIDISSNSFETDSTDLTDSTDEGDFYD